MRSAQSAPSVDWQSSVERLYAVRAGTWSILVAFGSFVRALPLFASRSPRTPLRVLCIIAFDAIHIHRSGQALPIAKLRLLARLLDLGACANAVFDHKQYLRSEYHAALQSLSDAGIGPEAAEYLRRLRQLEGSRPIPGGDSSRFQQVKLYREAVVRLSLGMVSSIAGRNRSLDEGIRSTYCDADLNLLFRLVMQCQITDDVLDYAKDAAAGLPGFLTATSSLPQAVDLTRRSIRDYAEDAGFPPDAELLSLAVSLSVLTVIARLVIFTIAKSAGRVG